ncbi:hypothetical protein BDZ89DRAFT_1080860 [Hymenopellis radicata]|nr:hypothetical protein BDZ89DRAFT_1080860 [Hymenopellis radicata]
MHPIDGGAAPILTFPTEILQTIFSFDQDTSPYELRPESRYPQLRLAHVCRTWRYAAFGLPSLGDRSASSANGHAIWSWRDAFNMFLSFAKNFPLMVEIWWWYEWADAEALSEFRDISAALFETSPRWKAASLSFQYEIDWSLLDPLHTKLPLLEDLSFDVNKRALRRPIVVKPSNAFSVVPSLRSVRFRSRNGGLAPLEIPWHQITCLSIRLPDPEIPRFAGGGYGVVTIGSSGELKELPVHDTLHNCASPSSSVILPSLTHFSFGVDGERHLVGSLILPALRELTVWDDYFRGPNDSGALVVDIARELICRSGCTITVLNIESYIPSTAQPLADVAVHFHALTHLSIRAAGFYMCQKQDAFRSILTLLTPVPASFDAGERNIFPLLEHLTLTRPHSSNTNTELPVSRATADALCDMLELRYPSHSAPPRLFTHAAIFPRVGRFPSTRTDSTLIEEFKRSAGWARITRVYQGQLDISIQVTMDFNSWIRSDFEMWLGRTDGGRSPYV